jgi:hypothetical protein
VRWRRSDGLSEMAETRRKRKAHSDASGPPEFVEPMKAKVIKSLPSGDWIYEIKFLLPKSTAMRRISRRHRSYLKNVRRSF